MSNDPLAALASVALSSSVQAFVTPSSPTAGYLMAGRAGTGCHNATPPDEGRPAASTPQISTRTAVSSLASDIIVLPSELLSTGEWRVEEVNLAPMKRPELLSLIRQWRLKPERMNKASFISTLKCFSENRETWEMKKPIHIRFHKGPTTNAITAERQEGHLSSTQGRKRQPKRSTLRREQIMIHPIVPPPLIPRRSKDMRTIPQYMQMADWARMVVEHEGETIPQVTCPDVTGSHSTSSLLGEKPSDPTSASQLRYQDESIVVPHLSHTPSEHQSTHASFDRTNSSSISQKALMSQILKSMERLEQRLETMQSPIKSARPPMAHCSARTSEPLSHQEARRSSRWMCNADSSIELGSGVLHFNSMEIPDPPYVSFAKDLDKLDRMWDDHSPSWDNSSPLILRETSIALIHWPKVYQYRQDKRWAGIKHHWSIWKFLVTEYRLLTPTCFWQKYSEGGKQLPVTKIAALQKKARKARDENLAAQAKETFGDQFSRMFAYRTGGESTPRVMTSASSIARTFQKLTGAIQSS